MIPALTPDLLVSISLVGLAACFLLALVRLGLGPSLPDRVIALDVIVTVGAGLIAAYAITNNQSVLIDAAIVLGLIVFLGTVAFARYLERKGQDE